MDRYKITITASAIQDIRLASDWYNEQKPGLDVRLLAEIKAAYGKLSINPELSGFYSRSRIAKRIRLKHFPYYIFFQ